MNKYYRILDKILATGKTQHFENMEQSDIRFRI